MPSRVNKTLVNRDYNSGQRDYTPNGQPCCSCELTIIW